MASRIIDKVGNRYGRLVVLNYKEIRNRRSYWTCKCDCGQVIDARGDHLTSGNTKSCGCLYKEQHILNLTSNRGKKRDVRKKKSCSVREENTRFYDIWRSMKKRCLNINCKDYPNYGGRGILICEKWITFENFKNDMLNSYEDHVKIFGEKDTTLDRIDVDGNYSPENCRWATQKEQQRNKTNNKVLIFQGKEYIASDLAREYNLLPTTFLSRLYNGWDLEKALNTPVKTAK